MFLSILFLLTNILIFSDRLFVDRKDTDIILMHHWSEDTFDKHREMFNSLLTYWKLVKNYDSAEQKAEA